MSHEKGLTRVVVIGARVYWDYAVLSAGGGGFYISIFNKSNIFFYNA